MRAAVLVFFAFVVLLLGGAKAQGFCPKYATALGLTQSALMETVITDVANRVFTDPITRPWFTGANNKGTSISSSRFFRCRPWLQHC